MRQGRQGGAVCLPAPSAPVVIPDLDRRAGLMELAALSFQGRSKVRQSVVWLAVAALGLGVIGCEPTTITEAKDQLGRGGARALAFVIPVRYDTLSVADVLEKLGGLTLDTLADSVVAVALDPESLRVDVGPQLQFSTLGFDQYRFSFNQMLETSETSTGASFGLSSPAGGPALAPNAPDTLRFATPNGSDVQSATIDTGTVVRTLANASCPATVSMALVDAAGDTAVAFADAAMAPFDTLTDSVTVNNATFNQFVEVKIDAVPNACVPAVGDTVDAQVTFRPLTLSQVVLNNVNETFTEMYDVLASEARLQAVDTVVVQSGSLRLIMQNRLPVTIDVAVTLNGMLAPGGAPLSANSTVPAAPGDGTTKSDTLTIDLTGATIRPAQAQATVTGTATAGSATITPTVSTDAVVVDGDGSLVVQRLSGALDPTKTPELTVNVEESQEIPRSDLDLGQFEDVVKDATLNAVQISLGITNEAGVPITLNNFRLGAVQIDLGTGLPKRDGGGNLVYETDGSGNPLFVDTTVTAAGAATTTVRLRNAATAALVDRLVHLLLDDTRVALVGTGTAVVGDGTQASISAGDGVRVTLGLAVGLDLTLPIAGVQFDSSSIQGGLDLDAADADELVSRLDSAGVTVALQNGTPFELEATIAVVADSFPGDVFTATGRVDIPTVTAAAATVDGSGKVTSPTASSVAINLLGDQTRVFMDSLFTAGIRVRLKPPTGQRGALRATDRIIVRASARIFVHTGGSQ